MFFKLWIPRTTEELDRNPTKLTEVAEKNCDHHSLEECLLRDETRRNRNPNQIVDVVVEFRLLFFRSHDS